MRRRLGLAAAAVLLLAAGCSGTTTGAAAGGGTSDAGGGTSARSTLPDVTLPALRTGGKAIDLGTLKGPAVVNLWANWCSPCRKEMPVIEKYHRQTPGVRVIGVNALDTNRTLARQVADQSGVTYPLVVDEDQAIPAIGLPRTLLVDARGRITYSAYTVVSSVAELQALVSKHLPESGATAGAAQ